MLTRIVERRWRTLLLALVACSWVAIKTWKTIGLGFNMADEGFLWYGMQRVLEGDLPLRDFNAYDPFRYFWGALFMKLMGSNGLLPMRLAIAAFEAIGVFFALSILARRVELKGLIGFAAGALAISMWMSLPIKSYDQTASIVLLASLAYLVESPTARRFFVAGVVLGVLGIVGRNHLLYGFFGTGLAALYLFIRQPETPFLRALGSWLAGLLAGYSPVLAMIAFVPGFAAGYMELVRTIMFSGRTNLPVPVPWPWTAQVPPNAAPGFALWQLLLGLCFVAFIVLGLAALCIVLWRKLKGRPVTPEFAACAFLILPYSHYAFSRADISHVAFGGIPLFLGILLASRRFGVVGQTAVGLAAAWASSTLTSPLRPVNLTERITVGGMEVLADEYSARAVALVDTLNKKYAQGGEPFLVAPIWTSAYPLHSKKAPVWDIYALFPRDEAFQRRELETIKAASPAFILIIDEVFENNQAILYRSTHPIVWQWILDNYAERPEESPHPKYRVFLPKDPAE